jgi:branched-chain amino acid transport system permease protein
VSQSATSRRVFAHLDRGARWRPIEIAFWLAIPALIFALPSRALLINEILLAGLFALSLDLVLGYAGIVSLGQAAFFGVGAYGAGIIANAGLADPLFGLVVASLIAGALGLLTAPLLLRGSDLTRLMVTLGVSLLLGELANRNAWATGGADGLSIALKPVLGLFPIDFTGQRNAALYSLAVLFLLFVLARRLVQSPFGLSVRALKENRLRSGALGVPAAARFIAIYGIAAVYAGASGALVAQTTGIVSLDVFDFHRSADVMLMLIIGGTGYLYGGLIGAALFIALKDMVSSATPEYWEFWIGLPLVVLVVVGRERVGAFIAKTLAACGASLARRRVA